MFSSTAQVAPIAAEADAHGVLERVQLQIQDRSDARCAVDTLLRATDGECYLCGGTIRRAVFGTRCFGDIDVMVPNGDTRAMAALDSLGVPYRMNSYHHRKYRWNTLEIDLFEPREFFEGYESIPCALRSFDLRINALAIHM